MLSLRGKICETIILSWISNESIVREVTTPELYAWIYGGNSRESDPGLEQ